MAGQDDPVVIVGQSIPVPLGGPAGVAQLAGGDRSSGAGSTAPSGLTPSPLGGGSPVANLSSGSHRTKDKGNGAILRG